MRTSLRNFFDRFVAAGIGDPKKIARYSDNIQLVSVVDDPGTSPRSWTTYAFRVLLDTAALGDFPTIELQAGPNGLWIMGYQTGSIAATINTWGIAELTPAGGPWRVGPTQMVLDEANISIFGDGVSQARVQFGGRLKPDLPTFHWRSRVNTEAGRTESITATGTEWSGSDIWLSPGRVLVYQHLSANDRFGGVIWREST